MAGGGYPEGSPFMRPEFVLSEEPNEPPLPRQQQHVPLNSRCCSSDHSRTIASDCSSSRHSSPFPKPGLIMPTAEETNNNGTSYTNVADLPDDVREQVRSLLTDDNMLQGTNSSQSLRPLQIGEPTRLSAQPTVEEIQMCFAQIDLAILMETKPAPVPRRFMSPNSHDKRAVSSAQPHAAASANHDNVPEYDHHNICARRAFRSPPRLLIPERRDVPTSESDTSSLNIHPDVMSEVCRAATVSPDLNTMNNVVNESANQPISRMQQLLIERANFRRKSAAAAAMRNSGSDRPAVSKSSRASSPATAVTLPVTPSSMQQQLVQRANIRRSLQANMTSTEEPLFDAAARRSVDRGPDQARIFASPTRNSSGDRRQSSPDHYHEAQTIFSSVREDFLQKLQQIQELAVAGARGSPSASNNDGVEGGGQERGSNEKEKKRAYQNPIWTQRSCSSSSLNGGRYRTQEEDNLCLDTDIESS